MFTKLITNHTEKLSKINNSGLEPTQYIQTDGIFVKANKINTWHPVKGKQLDTFA